MRTIEDVDLAGMDLRVFCWRCERTAVIDGWIWVEFKRKGWSIDMAEARRHFRCKVCKPPHDILLTTATRPSLPERTWSQEVQRFFFENKSKRLFRPDG